MSALNVVLASIASFFEGLPAAIAGNWYWFLFIFLVSLALDPLIAVFNKADKKGGSLPKWPSRFNIANLVLLGLTGALVVVAALISVFGIAPAFTATAGYAYLFGYWYIGAFVAAVGLIIVLPGKIRGMKALIPIIPGALGVIYVAAAAVVQAFGLLGS